MALGMVVARVEEEAKWKVVGLGVLSRLLT